VTTSQTGTRRAAGRRTRSAILRQAASLATVNGLDGLTIGDLATAVGMSKSGLYAHFRSKVDLQLATIDEAQRIFQEEVIDPALTCDEGLHRLLALTDAFVEHLRRRTFPGGCFFAGAVLEMGTRPGPVKDRIADFQAMFSGFIRSNVSAAMARGEISPDENPDWLTFEINGQILAADAAYVLRDDPAVLDMAKAVIRRRLAAMP
jgi:AcrR family transcriptional regulator